MALSVVLLISLPSVSVAQTTEAVEVGTVLELSGVAKAKLGEALPKAMRPLDFVVNGTELDLAAGASMVLTLYANGTEYQMIGPATVRVGKTELSSLTGKPLVKVTRVGKSAKRGVKGTQ